MRINSHIGFWKLTRSSLAHLLIVALGLAIAFVTLTLLNGVLQLFGPINRSAQEESPASLVISVFPADAMITLNAKPYNPKDILVPGDYVVRATHDAFFSSEEMVRVHPNQQNQLNIRLMSLVTIDELAHDATAPGWDEQNNLYFLNVSEGKIYNSTDNVSFDKVDAVGMVQQLIYLSAGDQALIVASDGPESPNKFFLINFQTKEVAELPVAGYAGYGWDGVIWGINSLNDDRKKPVWKLVPGREPQFFSLENQEWAIYVDQLLVDSSGQWLAIGSSKGIAIWEIASGRMVASFEGAFAPVWVQNPRPGLAFLDTDHSLNFARADLNWGAAALLKSIRSPLATMPGGSEIVFTRYNPFAGGASFWAVDTATMGVRLLSEAKTESGKAEEFALSLDGKKIAFVNQKNILFLITLEP